MIVMAILSFQGYYGGVTFPFKGPFSCIWWESLIYDTVAGTPTHATEIHTAAKNSLFLSVAAGVLVAFLAFTRSMAFRRRWRFRTDAAGFYLIMLALMTPGFLLAVGTQLFWAYLGLDTSIWKTALGANVSLGHPVRVPRHARRLEPLRRRGSRRRRATSAPTGARTFREVTLPLVWTGIFGCFLFGFTLTWNDYDRSVLFQTQGHRLAAARDRGHHLHGRGQARSLRARHRDDPLLAARDRRAARRRVAPSALRRNSGAPGRGGARSCRRDRHRAGRDGVPRHPPRGSACGLLR